MKYLSLGVLFLGSSMAAGAQTPAPEGGDKILREPLTLTGCVTKGTKANTFLLTNVQRTDTPGRAPIEPAVYWLSSPDKLKGHAGHRVEITGMLEDDVDKSEVKTEDGKVELSTERASKRVEVVEDTAAGAAVKAVGTAGKVVTFKVKVKSVRMLSTICS
jgi:hypothetical protein